MKRTWYAIIWFSLWSHIACETQKSDAKLRPTDETEELPGYLDTVEKDVDPASEVEITVGKSRLKAPVGISDQSFRVRLSQRSSAPVTEAESTTSIGNALGDIVDIELFNAETGAVLSSSDLKLEYEFKQTVSSNVSSSELGLIVVVDPDTDAQKRFLIPNDGLSISPGLRLKSGDELVIVLQLKLTNATMWLVKVDEEILNSVELAYPNQLVSGQSEGSKVSVIKRSTGSGNTSTSGSTGTTSTGSESTTSSGGGTTLDLTEGLVLHLNAQEDLAESKDCTAPAYWRDRSNTIDYGQILFNGCSDNQVNGWQDNPPRKLFDGNNSFASIASRPVHEFGQSTSFSIAAKFQTSAAGFIVSKMTLEQNPQQVFGYELIVGMDMLVYFQILSTFDQTIQCKSTTLVAESGNEKWIRAVATYDRVAIKLYINGIEECTAEDTSNSIYPAVGPLYIGNRASFMSQPFNPIFNGAMSDVRIYNRVLTKEEIDALNAID